MTSDTPDQARDTAVEQLTALGLSTYAARTFVALVRLGDGTAQDVSDVADVPRTRVYDAVDELRGRGLVDVQQSSPKRFWAISTETTGRQFEREYSNRVSALTEALDSLASPQRSTEQRGVWTVTGRDAVTERVVDLIDAATDEVVFMTVEALLTPEVAGSLRTASERGVAVHLAEMSRPAEQQLADRVPEARRFESLWDWSDTPAGRLLMVDEERTLASVLVDEGDDPAAESREETAIWGRGETNSLVVVLKALFTWQLNGTRD